MRDVAIKAGVAPITVSRTFRTPDLLSENTQRRVLRAAEQLGYTPPRSTVAAMAANTGEGKTVQRTRSARTSLRPSLQRAIGFQFLDDSADVVLASNMFYAPLLAGAQAEATALDLHLLVHTTNHKALEVELPRMVDEKIIDGMLVVGNTNRAALDRLTSHVPRIVLVDNWSEVDVFESVISGGFAGARAATQYLIELGHRRICFFMTRRNIATFQDRLDGYRCALLSAGLSADLAPVIAPEGVDEDWGAYGITDRLQALLQRSPEPPTAILAANDDCALLAQRVGRQAGLRLPEQLSIIGFDDLPFTAHADPPLTTVHVDKEAMGRLAVRRLWTRIIADESAEESVRLPPVQHVVPVSLVHRESCAPAFRRSAG